MVYLNIDKEFFEKNKASANEKAKEELDEESGENCYLFDLKDEECYIEEIEKDGTLKIISKSELGYIYFDIKLDEDDYTNLVQILVSKLNKFKNIMESLK